MLSKSYNRAMDDPSIARADARESPRGLGRPFPLGRYVDGPAGSGDDVAHGSRHAARPIGRRSGADPAAMGGKIQKHCPVQHKGRSRRIRGMSPRTTTRRPVRPGRVSVQRRVCRHNGSVAEARIGMLAEPRRSAAPLVARISRLPGTFRSVRAVS